MRRVVVMIVLLAIFCMIPFLIPKEDNVFATPSKVSYRIGEKSDDLATYSDIHSVIEDLTN